MQGIIIVGVGGNEPARRLAEALARQGVPIEQVIEEQEEN